MLPSPISLSQRRIHSPSLPDLWVPPANRIPPSSGAGGVNTVQFPPAARPSLGSLDLASPPNKSALPLTPPLTPASTKPADSEPSEARSSRSNSFDISHFDPYAHDFSPISQWSSSDTSSMHNRGPAESEHFSSINITDASVLPSPTSPTRPKRSPAPRAIDLEPDFETQPASRFLFISGVPKVANSQALKQAFVACGDLKGIFVRFQAEHGAIILAFFDVRHTIRAQRQINTHTFFDGVRLASRFISADELRNLIGQSNFVNQNDGDLFITTSFVGPERELDPAALQNVLASFGDLRSFGITDTHARAFHVEYFDARDVLSALNALSGRVILGVRLHLTLRDAEASTGEDKVPFPRSAFADAPPSPTAPTPTGIPFPSKPAPTPSPALERRGSVDSSLHGVRHPGLHHSISEQDLRARAKSQSTTPQPSHPHPPPTPRVKTPPQHMHGRRISNIYHFDSVGKMELPRTPPRPRSISVSSDTESPVAGRLALPPSPTAGAGRLVLAPSESPASARVGLPPYQGPLPVPVPGAEDAQWPREREAEAAPYAYMPEQYFMAPVQQPQQAGPASPVLQLQTPAPPRRQSLLPRHAHAHGLGLEMSSERERERELQPERNRIDIGRIERGEETRTTVMIKNIPNKMSDRHLIEFINDVCPRKIDFLYLRMDFTNGCNVGYAFVNFIRVEDLLHFAKTKLGTKWNLFSSEKVLGMSYANYQGKEALIDKFRSSSIMDQREAWRPKLFYSHGPKKGLPEDFPAPTHLRRKERSSLVPSELHQSRALFHHPPGMRG